jgi:hypothetical protein
MSDALWAARAGDALAHTSMLADVLGGVLEVAANVAIGVLATAAVVAATGITLATGAGRCGNGSMSTTAWCTSTTTPMAGWRR